MAVQAGRAAADCITWATREARGRLIEIATDNVRAFLAGNPPKKIVKRVIRAQIKIGAPVELEGSTYRFGGSVTDLKSGLQ